MFFNQAFYFLFDLDLRVRCNGKVLDQNDYQIADRILSFETPACLQDPKDLEIVIDKQKHGIYFYKNFQKK